MSKVKRIAIAVLGGGILIAGAASCSQRATAAVTPSYTPQVRRFAVTAVPLLVHEQTGTYDFLKAAFAKRGVLDGKEVWGFSPSSITVYKGDTVDIRLVNLGDDAHTFTIAELGVNVPMKPRATGHSTFAAIKVGVFQFACEVGEHMPFMAGQITVLPDSDAA